MLYTCNASQRYVQISYTEFHPDRRLNVGSRDTNSFTTVSQITYYFHWAIFTKFIIAQWVSVGTYVPIFVQVGRKTHKIGQNLMYVHERRMVFNVRNFRKFTCSQALLNHLYRFSPKCVKKYENCDIQWADFYQLYV